MLTDTLYTGEEVRNRLISGIKKASQAVGGTMGTSGHNSLLEDMRTPGYMTTNDGATILEAMHFTDPIEEIGRKILVEAVSRANKSSGDGSSTCCIITTAILEEGIKYLGEVPPMELKRSLEACIPLIEESINKQKREIGVDSIASVASISAEDEEIGNRIQEIYQKIGKAGIIHWDISKTDKDSYTIGQGITVDGATIASPYMCNRDKTSGNFTNSAKLKDPQIIITKEKLTTAGVFETLFVSLNNQGKKEVVVFCEDFDVNVVAQFVATQQVQGFRTIIVKMPTLWADHWYIDLALASGATLLDPSAGLSLKNIKQEHLGTFSHITIDKEATYIDGIKDLSSHIQALEAEATDDSLLRASRLNTKTARYYVGGISESYISHRRYKTEDAIAASFHALNGGIVGGGGVALLKTSRELNDSIGGKILMRALEQPFRTICLNAGIDYEVHGLYFDGETGYDTRTKQQVNMFTAQITDPATITLNAVKNAISVSASILTINTLVLLPREQQTHQIPNGVYN